MLKGQSDIILSSLSFKNDAWVDYFFTSNYYSFLSFSSRYIPERRKAEDVVQDVFAKLIISAKEFSDESQVKSYVYVMLRNACLNHLRNEKVKDHMIATMKLLADDSVYFNYILEEELFDRLFEEIDKLPEQTRNVFILALEGDKNQEIADKLNISIETVKTHKKIGKGLLRKRMSDVMALYYYLLMLL